MTETILLICCSPVIDDGAPPSDVDIVSPFLVMPKFTNHSISPVAAAEKENLNLIGFDVSKSNGE